MGTLIPDECGEVRAWIGSEFGLSLDRVLFGSDEEEETEELHLVLQVHRFAVKSFDT
jgi:hypothetical protein